MLGHLLIFFGFISGHFLHAVLEGADTFAGTTHEFGDFLTTEQEEDNNENDDDFLYAEAEE